MSILDKLRTKSQPTPQEEVETEVKITKKREINKNTTI